MTKIYQAHIIDRGGECPWICPQTGTALITGSELEEYAGIKEENLPQGTTCLTIEVFRDHWNIISYGGYTSDTGLFYNADKCGRNI